MSTQFKPILFSTEMVQAILEGRKTQTRRTKGLEKINENPDDWYFTNCTASCADKKEFYFKHRFYEGDDCDLLIPCPYGNIGDILWVREKHRVLIDCETNEFAGYWYYADMPEKFHKEYKRKWKPSIHMPKAACRLFLRITNVRVERLHDISDTDVMNEGAQDSLYAFSELATPPKPGWMRQGFERLWTRINGTESWNANPWVWVIEFERVEKPTNF